MAKSNLPDAYVQEEIEYNYLYLLGATRTTTGQISWTSTSSGITYNTTGGVYDNQGQYGLMMLVQAAITSYLITAPDFNNKSDNTDYIRQPGYAATSGTSTAYTVTLSPVPAAYVNGFGVTIVPHATCGTSPTLNVNGLGAISLLNAQGVAFAAGSLLINTPYSFKYQGGSFFAVSSGTGGNAGTGDVLATKTFTNDSGQQTGAMTNKVGSATIITPSTSDIAIAQGYYGGAAGDGKVLGSANLVAGNIQSGVNIFGVTGTAKRQATGQVYAGSSAINISGLGFRPSGFIIRDNTDANYPVFWKNDSGFYFGYYWYYLNLPPYSGYYRVLINTDVSTSGGINCGVSGDMNGHLCTYWCYE